MKEIIARHTATSVQELIDSLKRFTLADPSTVYVKGPTGEDVSLALEEETLSDGSVVYNIILGEVKS